MKQNRFLRIVLNNLLLVVPVAAGICILAVFIVFAQGPQKKPGGETAEHVRIIEAPSIDVVPQAVGYGTVEPTRVWKAVAEVSGDIIQIHPRLDAGELILEPTTLLQIDPAEYKLAVQQFQAQLNQDEARLKELETNLNNYQSLLAIQKEILALSEKELKRKQALLEKGDFSPSAYEQEQRQVASQRSQVQQLENNINLVPDQRSTIKAQMAVTESKLEQAKINLEKTTIRLPFPARIIHVPVEKHIFVKTGEMLLEAHSLESVEITAEIQPAFMFRMLNTPGVPLRKPAFDQNFEMKKTIDKLGLKAKVLLPVGHKKIPWDADVVRIRGTMNPKTRTIGVVVKVDDPYEKIVLGQRPPLIQGMFCEVKFWGKPKPGSIVIPRSAWHKGRVYTVDKDSRLRILPAKEAFIQDDMVVLEEGIDAGQPVVVTRLSPAVEGMPLKTTHDDDLLDRLKRNATLQAE